jgi:opacity protein-like surface antigen
MRRSLLAFVLILAAAIAIQPAYAQSAPPFQKWDAYGGYSYLNTPTLNLDQHGFNLTVGRNFNRWLAVGADFSHFSGSGVPAVSGQVLANVLFPSIGAVPSPIAGATFVAPLNASTTTFAMGPQLQFRKSKWVTPFVHPFLGAFHMSADAKPSQIRLPTNLPPAVLASFAPVLATAPATVHLSDTVAGYGVGGGADLNLTRPIGLRMAVDYIRSSLLHDQLNQSQNNVRISFGLIYRFGGDVMQK